MIRLRTLGAVDVKDSTETHTTGTGGEKAPQRNPLRGLVFNESGREDLTLRPPGPEPGALTGLRYAPRDAPRNLEADELERKPVGPCGLPVAPVFPWTRSMTSDVVVRTRYSPRTAM